MQFVCAITRHRFWAGITKFEPSMHPGILVAGIEMGAIDLDFKDNFGHLTQNSSKFGLSAQF